MLRVFVGTCNCWTTTPQTTRGSYAPWMSVPRSSPCFAKMASSTVSSRPVTREDLDPWQRILNKKCRQVWVYPSPMTTMQSPKLRIIYLISCGSYHSYLFALFFLKGSLNSEWIFIFHSAWQGSKNYSSQLWMIGRLNMSNSADHTVSLWHLVFLNRGQMMSGFPHLTWWEFTSRIIALLWF